jgi:hypothetical protein
VNQELHEIKSTMLSSISSGEGGRGGGTTVTKCYAYPTHFLEFRVY